MGWEDGEYKRGGASRGLAAESYGMRLAMVLGMELAMELLLPERCNALSRAEVDIG